MEIRGLAELCKSHHISRGICGDRLRRRVESRRQYLARAGVRRKLPHADRDRGRVRHRGIRRGRRRHAVLPGGRTVPELRGGKIAQLHFVADGYTPRQGARFARRGGSRGGAGRSGNRRDYRRKGRRAHCLGRRCGFGRKLSRYLRADGRIGAAFLQGGRRGAQRLGQHRGRSAYQVRKTFLRFHRQQDTRPCGKRGG